MVSGVVHVPRLYVISQQRERREQGEKQTEETQKNNTRTEKNNKSTQHEQIFKSEEKHRIRSQNTISP